MTKRIRTRTIDTTAHSWEVEKTIVASAMRKHPSRLKTLKMASYCVYLIFCHCFGLDGHEDCKGSQTRISDHLAKEHGMIVTGNQEHDSKHTVICWLTNAKRRRRTNRVARLFDEVMGNWQSRVGQEPGAGIRFLEKHQRFRQTLSDVLEQKLDFLDKLEKYERIYRKTNNQKLFLPEIVREFVQGKEISQIVFELKNSGIEIIEKDADLSLEVAVIFSGEKTRDGDISDQAREIVEAIKGHRLSSQGGELMCDLNLIRDHLKEAISADTNILTIFMEKVETWKKKGGEDLFLIETINKFLAGDDDSTIESGLNLSKDDGIKRLELALRLLGSDVQLQDQSDWVNTTKAEIEKLWQGKDVKQIIEEQAIEVTKPSIRIGIFYAGLWECCFNHAKEQSNRLLKVDGHNAAVWKGPYYGSYVETVKSFITTEYPATVDSTNKQIIARWSYLMRFYKVIRAPSLGRKKGKKEIYYILDPNDFDTVLKEDSDHLKKWLYGPDSQPKAAATEALKGAKAIQKSGVKTDAPIEVTAETMVDIDDLIRDNNKRIVELNLTISRKEQLIWSVAEQVGQLNEQLVQLKKEKGKLVSILTSTIDQLKILKGEEDA